MNQKLNTENAIVEILLKDIAISPFNDRWGNKPPNENNLRELAESIKTHEVIQAVLVRPLPKGKFELVVGERRFRASGMAGKKTIKATIRELTDEQVQEIQLIENMQRENPHPMSEAIAIQKLLNLSHLKNKVEEVANRLGKSAGYVYQRSKLCELNDNFREMYFADAINTTQALKIARLDAKSQDEFFASNCEDWKEEDWEISNFNNRIRNYQLDLGKAPFNTKDAKLDKKAGACTRCLHNTAATTSLFPEDSKDARCTNRPCYENKCRLFAILNLADVIRQNPLLPIAISDDAVLSFYFSSDDKLIRDKKILIEGIDYRFYDELPEKPVLEKFDFYEEEEENMSDYQEAVNEFETEQTRMMDEVAAGNYLMAILINENTCDKVVFLNQKTGESQSLSSVPFTQSEFKAKDYHEALKAKTLTPELIESEIQRLKKREERSKELDTIKLQETFYKTLEESDAIKSIAHPAGLNDKAVSVFLLFESLNYFGRNQFNILLKDQLDLAGDKDDRLLHFFFHASENQISVLIRLAILNLSESKTPNSLAGQMLRKLIEGTQGVDAGELVDIQRAVTKEREHKLNEKLLLLDKQAEKIH
jgi:ParB family chromosome partitioning protein